MTEKLGSRLKRRRSGAGRKGSEKAGGGGGGGGGWWGSNYVKRIKTCPGKRCRNYRLQEVAVRGSGKEVM